MTNDKPEHLEPSNEAWLREQRRTRRAAQPLEDSKTTAPPTMPALSPREAARLWGVGGFPGDGLRRRYPYSIT